MERDNSSNTVRVADASGCSAPQSGLICINADDWGRDIITTNRTLDCVRAGGVTSASAMMFMEDSVRAAQLAVEHEVDVGLHLNFTTAFSAQDCPSSIKEQQQRIAGYLSRHRLAQVCFHPGLVNAFAYVVDVQLEEYRRLYGRAPSRIDGHHHMHLSMNVLFQGLLPRGTIVRRNFSFEAGEKSIWNRCYRSTVDRWLARHHQVADYFFSLVPLDSGERIKRILALSRDHVVEVEVHPVNQIEYEFLMGAGIKQLAGDLKIGAFPTMSHHPEAVASARKG